MPIRGIVTPLLTPLAAPDALDPAALERLIAHVLAGGVNGLFVLGTTGEGPALPYRLRRELVERACRQAAGRVPVLVGVTDSSFEEVIASAGHAAKAGAAGVVSAGPVYFPVSQAELLRYLRELAPALPLPLYLYNMPSHTHVSFDVDTVVEAAKAGNIAGLKDSSGDMMYLHRLRLAFPRDLDFTVLVGPEELLAEAVLFGADGGVNGGSNLFPRLYTATYEAAVRGDLARATTLHRVINEVSARLYAVGSYGSSYLRGIKCAASVLGLCSDVMAAPYASFRGVDRQQVETSLAYLQAILEEAGLDASQEALR